MNSEDALHGIALDLADRLQAGRTSIVTSRPILLEIGDGLSKPTYRRVAAALLASIDGDASIEIVELSESLYSEGLQLYCQRLDKGWGMTDCISFALMKSRGITAALTHDIHFAQAGFHALMRTQAT